MVAATGIYVSAGAVSSGCTSPMFADGPFCSHCVRRGFLLCIGRRRWKGGGEDTDASGHVTTGSNVGLFLSSVVRKFFWTREITPKFPAGICGRLQATDFLLRGCISTIASEPSLDT